MIDFKKKLNQSTIDKKINPVEIYSTLDRKSVAGPLRPAQKNILDNWFDNYLDVKDLIIKLHTGEGKTLIGLLILQSKINSTKKPCLFVCPNIYLVEQVSEEAKKFGIPTCIIDNSNQIPNEFLEGKKILITHFQKVFNGKSIFGTGNNFIETECIILDDSHACIDSIKSSFSIKITKSKSEQLYNSLKNLFEEDLRNQGEGSFLDVMSGKHDTLMMVPYWSWIEKKSDVLSLLSSNDENKEILFAWPIIKDYLEHCSAIINGQEIEITPVHIPIQNFGTFSKSNQRILMSATTQDDSFFIKGLGFSIDSVTNPLAYSQQKWSGEKMLLIPSLIDEELNRELIISKFAPPFDKKYGISVIVPSLKKSEIYYNQGANVAKATNIFENIVNLKRGNFTNTLIIVNRYDGIDLPDESCRILILDSIPYFSSLSDKYEELCRSTSDMINIKIAQKIEQGLGRSVRGEKDYTVILIIGTDLVKFIRSVRTNKYFSPQTRKQIDIGLEITEMALEEIDRSKSSFSIVSSLINQSLKRDEGWKEYYKLEMDKIDSVAELSELHLLLQIEKEAEEASFKGDFEVASNKVQLILNQYIKDDNEKGWYLQQLARYQFHISKTESNKIQKSAFQSNLQLLKPKEGINYKKIEYINENRINRIKNWIHNYKNYEELSLSIDYILSNLSFGGESEKFENALKEVGELLGFVSQRPDKEVRKGPDNLWGGIENKYFMFECKNEVDDSRDEIHKNEASQMNSHCGWFEEEYGTGTMVKRFMIIPTKNLSYYANFTHEVTIIKKGKLRDLKNNIKSFIKEFKSYNINEISDEKIQSFLNINKLTIENLENYYSETYFKRKNI